MLLFGAVGDNVWLIAVVVVAVVVAIVVGLLLLVLLLVFSCYECVCLILAVGVVVSVGWIDIV